MPPHHYNMSLDKLLRQFIEKDQSRQIAIEDLQRENTRLANRVATLEAQMKQVRTELGLPL